ncbi:hypothetical protein K449DRAFT_432007 [Hypoxylon sp. EC38]|nr:hypothetical protein K449DRAFT_432007 [Hypoxylon sp. EC38]
MDISGVIAVANLLTVVAVPVIETVIAIGTSVPRFSARGIPKRAWTELHSGSGKGDAARLLRTRRDVVVIYKCWPFYRVSRVLRALICGRAKRVSSDTMPYLALVPIIPWQQERILEKGLSKVALCLSVSLLFYKIQEWKLPLEILLLFLLVPTPAYSFIDLAQ